jgi:hypothetical protein
LDEEEKEKERMREKQGKKDSRNLIDKLPVMPDKDDEESLITINSSNLEQMDCSRSSILHRSHSKLFSQCSNSKPIVIDDDNEFAEILTRSLCQRNDSKFYTKQCKSPTPKIILNPELDKNSEEMDHDEMSDNISFTLEIEKEDARKPIS